MKLAVKLDKDALKAKIIEESEKIFLDYELFIGGLSISYPAAGILPTPSHIAKQFPKKTRRLRFLDFKFPNLSMISCLEFSAFPLAFCPNFGYNIAQKIGHPEARRKEPKHLWNPPFRRQTTGNQNPTFLIFNPYLVFLLFNF